MAKDNENADSSNGENDEIIIDEISDDDDVTVLKEKYQNLSEANKKLYARTKKAEGFELKNGKWTKAPKEPKTETKIESKSNSEKSSELNSGDKAYLYSLIQLKGKDEFALAENWISRTGDNIEAMAEDEVFIGRLAKLREAKASAQATPSGTKRSQTSTKDSVEYNLEQYESGKMKLTDMDFPMREQVLEKALENKKNSDKFPFKSSF